MDADTGIVIGSGAVGAICGVAGTWIKAKFGKTRIPQPLETREQDRYVTCSECKQHREAIEKRLDSVGPALDRVFEKLDENDKRAEERATATHRRLDPLIQELGTVRGKVELLERQKK